MEKTMGYMASPIPGPWHYKKSGFKITVGNESTRHDYLEHDYTVCIIEDNSFQAEANARLLTAAPDLLKACKRFLDLGDRESVEMMKAAIAKAEGREE